MARQRHRRRKPRPPRQNNGVCEYCRKVPWVHHWAIDMAKPAKDRNLVHLCQVCRDMAAKGEIRPGELRLEANEREDRIMRELMGHPAYAREGHGAMRQIRD